MNAATTAHTTTVTTFSNGAPYKARRAACSCGYLGPRFAYVKTGPNMKAELAAATAKAQADADEHAARAR